VLAKTREGRLNEPAAAVLATATRDGRPSVRAVLLKQIDAQGITWFTNLNSRKGRQLAANPRAALCVFIDRAMEQVTIEGATQRLGDAEADAYWATRDRASQLGAWASRQSEALESRGALLARVAEARWRFGRGPIPRPPQWSGFRLVPDRIEFWKARPFRLNERVVYARDGGRWTSGLLYP
jgi:pyridoxamine 5'-phosphate oxidase